MRAGPLSNDDVIALLNDRFVPVYVSNEDYEGDGVATPAERAERDRVWREAHAAGLSSGTVHAYVLAPDGSVADSLHVAEAAIVERTRAMLERAVETFRPPSGPLPADAVRKQPGLPAAPDGGLTLHLVARYLRRDGHGLRTLAADAGLGSTRNASWQAYPAENWLILEREDVQRILPPATVPGSSVPIAVGFSWRPDESVLRRLLVHFYPSTECNDTTRNRIDEGTVAAQVIAVEGDVARARLSGLLRMRHPFYPGRDDDNAVDAPLLGYLEFETASGRVATLRLVTDGAVYASMPFGVALRSVVTAK